MSFYTSLTGLNAATAQLSVTSVQRFQPVEMPAQTAPAMPGITIRLFCQEILSLCLFQVQIPTQP
jgi:hypothetical protein